MNNNIASNIYYNKNNKMISAKQPNEFSKLLKDNETPQIVYRELYKKQHSKNIFNWLITKINEYFLLLLLLLIFFFSVSLYYLLLSIKEKNEIMLNFDDYDDDQEFINQKIYKPINKTNLYNETKMCTENKKFAILSRTNCQACGLFSYYIVHLGCIITYLNEGYIPIIEVGSFPNVFNGDNENFSNNNNSWETFFNQPCGYTLNQIKNDNKSIIEYIECECNDNMPSEKEVYSNQELLKYYRDMAKKYMSVKKEIIDEGNALWEKLFNNSKNVLGILARGTDYVTIKPYSHSIPPTAETAINDVKRMDKENKYDYFFLATEDNKIRDKFIKAFEDKLKYLLPEENVEYDYEEENYLTFNQEVYGNMKFQKTYLLSMYLLSKCVDIISARTSGAAGAFILSEGFRKHLVYYIGEY